MKTLLRLAMLGALLVMATTTASAATRGDLETTAVLDGNIVINLDGSVRDVTIDNAAKYGQPIADFVRKTALQWRFQPVLIDGKPVLAKSAMHARVVLKKLDGGQYRLRLKGATFGDADPGDTSTLRDIKTRKRLPSYPREAIRMRVQGTVYLALKVNHSGQVVEAVAEQVNLRNLGSEHEMKVYRQLLTKSAIAAALHWKYAIPTTGKLAAQDSWTARVPVTYLLSPLGEMPREQIWTTYVPGPYTPAPWVDKPDMNSADALADDSVHTDGAGPVLLTPISHG